MKQNDPEILRALYEASLAESGTRDTHEGDDDECQCSTCRMERARDTAMEPIR